VHADGGVVPQAINELIGTTLPEERKRPWPGCLSTSWAECRSGTNMSEIGDARLTVLAKDKNRITRLKIERLEPEMR